MNPKPLIVLLMALAFGLSPLVTPEFRGYDPAQFPIRLDRPAIQPAGYAFSIWSVIYLWLTAHAAYGLWKRADDPAWDAVRRPWSVALAVGAVWLWMAGRSPLWGTILIGSWLRSDR